MLAAALMGAVLLLERTMNIAAAAPPTGIKNVVLVHGAFADGSGWEAVAKILEKDGYTVSVAQPPETSYADDQKYTKAAIDAMGGPVVLVGHSYGGSIITEAGNDPNVAALVYIAAFALDEGESCASIEQAVPQASKAFKPDSNGNWWIEQEHFAADFAADVPPAVSHFMAHLAGADLHRLVHPQGHESRLEDQAHLVHGGHRRPVDQSGPGAHDGEARQCQDGRSECQPCGLHVSPEGNSQAHRRGCHLRTRQPVVNRSLRSSEKHVCAQVGGGLVRKAFDIENQTVRVDLNYKGECHERAY
jgi:pimeloyl-ACP methyl ester carboxylesterase